MTTYRVLKRSRFLVNTDPQRRCYNGAHYSYEYHWSAWEVLESNISLTRAERAIAFYTHLNDYAVSCRGESAKCEFKIEEE